MKILLILIFLFIFSIYMNKKKIEGFEDSPPSEYINLLPSDAASISKINIHKNAFKVNEVKKYFPKFIKKGIVKGNMPIVPTVDSSKMVGVSWKILDEFNIKHNLMREALDKINKTVISSTETLELLKEKSK